MRRLLLIDLPLLFAVTTATAAAQDKPIASPYYPLKVGNEWTYRAGKGLKESVVIRVDKEVTLELGKIDKDDKHEKAIGFRLRSSTGTEDVPEGEVAVLADGVYRFSTAGKAIKPPMRFLKLPVKAGDAWPIDSKTVDGKAIRGQFVTGTDTLQLVLAGKMVELPTVTVTSKDFTIGDETVSITYWFAQNIGMVKQQVRIGKDAVKKNDETKTAVTLELRAFHVISAAK
jgi:hypothetical protein